METVCNDSSTDRDLSDSDYCTLTNDSKLGTSPTNFGKSEKNSENLKSFSKNVDNSRNNNKRHQAVVTVTPATETNAERVAIHLSEDISYTLKKDLKKAIKSNFASENFQKDPILKNGLCSNNDLISPENDWNSLENRAKLSQNGLYPLDNGPKLSHELNPLENGPKLSQNGLDLESSENVSKLSANGLNLSENTLSTSSDEEENVTDASSEICEVVSCSSFSSENDILESGTELIYESDITEERNAKIDNNRNYPSAEIHPDEEKCKNVVSLNNFQDNLSPSFNNSTNLSNSQSDSTSLSDSKGCLEQNVDEPERNVLEPKDSDFKSHVKVTRSQNVKNNLEMKPRSRNEEICSSDTPQKSNPSIIITDVNENSSNKISNSKFSPKEDLIPSPSIRDTQDGYCDLEDQEYFEDFHLPNTYENTFVRHQSFKKKVKSIPINAPDAERIEGLVRTGEFSRHGSIRQKIILPEKIHEEGSFESSCEENCDKNEETSDSYQENGDNYRRNCGTCQGKSDNCHDNCDNYEDYEPGMETMIDKKRLKRSKDSGYNNNQSNSNFGSVSSKNGTKNDNFEQERSENRVENCNFVFDLRNSLEDRNSVFTSSEIGENSEDINSNKMEDDEKLVPNEIEDDTVRKIKECLDFSNYTDVLNLSGRLSDILSPKEVEVVLHNAERYRKHLNTEAPFVFEALSLSYHGQSQSLPYNINTLNQNQNNAITSKNQMVSQSSNSSIKSRQSDNINPRISISSSGSSGSAGNSSCIVLSNGTLPRCLKKIPVPELDSTPEILESDNDSEPEFVLGQYKRKIELTETKSKQPIKLPISKSSPKTKIFLEKSAEEVFLPLPPPDLIPELTAAEEMTEIHHWRNVVIGGAWRRIDMKIIAPFKKCVSHGGYMEGTQYPVVVISAAMLPEKTRRDYHYLMDNLFMYVLSFVEQLSSDDYVIVYFSHSPLTYAGPGFHWLRKAYEMIDRRLRKNLKCLYVVHPSIWSKTLLTLSRPFISSKFYEKIRYVSNLIELSDLIPIEHCQIPDAVKQIDFEVMIREKRNRKPSKSYNNNNVPIP